MSFLLSLLIATAFANPVVEAGFPCIRVFHTPDMGAATSDLEQKFPWASLYDGGVTLGYDLRVDTVWVDGEVKSASIALLRGDAGYKLFLEEKFRTDQYAGYTHPFSHRLPPSDRLHRLLLGKFNVFVLPDIAYIFSMDRHFMAICPRATIDWEQIRAETFKFLSNDTVAHHLKCGNLLNGPRPRD